MKKTYSRISVLLVSVVVCSCADPETNHSEKESLKVEVDSPGVNDYWLTNKIDHANIYLYFPELDGSTGDIESNGELSPFICDSMTKALDSARIADLQERLVYSLEEFVHGNDCYFPHHGIVYFDEKNEIIGSVSLCTACNQIQGDGVEIPVEYYESLIDSVGLPNDPIPMDTIDVYTIYRKAVRKKLVESGFEFNEEE